MNHHRRGVLAMIGAGALTLASTARAQQRALRFGLTAVFRDDQLGFLRLWRSYLEQRLARKVELVQRGSYREITEMLLDGRCDAAWICGFPYVQNRDAFRLVAVPLFEGKPLYRSYLIVPASDTATRSILDLRGKVFAFSDPDSNSGFLYPTFVLRTSGERSEAFFKRTFFTWAHRRVVDAVSASLAQGGAVDGYVWETLRVSSVALTAGTRVAHKSPEFGHPPIVAGPLASPETAEALRGVLTGMNRDADGRALLHRLNLDGFAPGSDQLFDSIDRMRRVVQSG